MTANHYKKVTGIPRGSGSLKERWVSVKETFLHITKGKITWSSVKSFSDNYPEFNLTKDELLELHSLRFKK